MAFAPKTDYCGLTSVFDTELAVRDDNKNDSRQTYAPVGQDGSVIAVELYGHDASPSNNYALQADITATANELKLGKLVTVGSSPSQEKFILKSVKFSTGVNRAVTVSASAEMVESGYSETAAKLYGVPAFSITTAHVAQDIFSAFSISDGANLVSCDANISLAVQKDQFVGEIISNGTGQAQIKISGSILYPATSGTPTVTVTTDSGFVITKEPTCQNPETAYRTFTFELTKPLARVGTSAQVSND